MRKEGSHQVAVNRGESFLTEEHGPFAGNLRSWRPESQGLIKIFNEWAGSWTPKSPQTAPEHSPVFSRVERGKGGLLAQETVQTLKASRPCLSPV